MGVQEALPLMCSGGCSYAQYPDRVMSVIGCFSASSPACSDTQP